MNDATCRLLGKQLCPPMPDSHTVVLFPKSFWEGGPTRPVNQVSVHHYQQNVHVENLQVNFNEQNVHVHAHDPAVISLVEATAELRHRELLSQAQAQAEALHKAKTEEPMEALRVREGIESQRARDAIMSNEDEMDRMGTRLREIFKHEAQEHVRLQETQVQGKIHAYQMVIDANHRHSLSSKEQEILELKRQAEEDRRLQNERVAQLEQMVQAQMQHNLKLQNNLKLQSTIDSQFAQARPPRRRYSAVTPPAFGDRDYIPPTSKSAPVAKPAMPTPGTSSWAPTIYVPISFYKMRGLSRTIKCFL